tara:strand:- start:161 stop:430 length:270 start_codon:yes stop_codon:yes gene_type:complete
MANYCYDIYESINKLSTSESVEFVKDFENEDKEGNEKNEREKEIEDSDVFLFKSISFRVTKPYNYRLRCSFQFSEISIYKEVDSPPPNC